LIAFSNILEDIYQRLRQTILDSVWVISKRTSSGILVKDNQLVSENIENPDEFTGNVLRTLRNTHHGYLTRGDQSFRPSRYLSLIDGNTSDDFPTLSLAWLLALLESPEALIGNPS